MNKTTAKPFKKRNPYLAIIWSYGLYVVLYFQLYLGAWLGTLVSDGGYKSLLTGSFKNHLTILVKGTCGVLIGVPLLYLCVRYLWRRKKEWMCLNFNLRLMGTGALLGIIAPLILTAILLQLGVVKITGTPGRLSFEVIAASIVGFLGWSLFKGVAEEAVFRGMAVRELAVKWGWFTASLVSGIYFGIAHILAVIHMISLKTAFIAVFAGVLAGFFFAALMIRSKSLWLPIGFHAGWNFCFSAVIGITMSGKTRELGLFQMEAGGSDWVTGGEFGIEGSLLFLLFYIAAALLIWKLPIKGKVDLLNPEPDEEIS
ncbi:MAG: CPBP family intramembrane metalloprotease [bacterium]|nr:CPBP family intramembrane metalloprotease [bacterium]